MERLWVMEHFAFERWLSLLIACLHWERVVWEIRDALVTAMWAHGRTREDIGTW